MGLYAKDSGDANWRIFGALHFLERQREWFLRVSSPAPDVTSVSVHSTLADANANVNVVATGGGATPVGTSTIGIHNGATAPDWSEGASYSTIEVVTETAVTGAELAIWTVDLGRQEDRIVQAVLRAITHVQTLNGYLHTLAKVDLGATVATSIPVDDLPQVRVGRGFYDQESQELGGVEAAGLWELRMECEAHSRNADGAGIDTNVFSLFHDIRRAIYSLENETFEGDGLLWSSIAVGFADPERPVQWIEEIGYFRFDVVATFELNRSELLAG